MFETFSTSLQFSNLVLLTRLLLLFFGRRYICYVFNKVRNSKGGKDGIMKKFLVIILSLTLLVSSMVMVGCNKKSASAPDSSTPGSSTEGEAKSLIVYSGAGLRKPIEELGKMFEEETGIEIQFTYGGTAQLIGQILTVDKGDVFLPGDVAELEPLREKDKVAEEKPVVYHIPILAVPKGNRADIKSLADLKNPGIKVVLGDPEANPIGKLSEKILKEKGIFEQVEPNIVARAATVNEMFAYLAMEQVDASIIWEDNLVGNDKIEIVETSDFDEYIKKVPIVTLKCSKKPESAVQFMDFVSSSKGIKIWEKWGFKPTAEDE